MEALGVCWGPPWARPGVVWGRVVRPFHPPVPAQMTLYGEGKPRSNHDFGCVPLLQRDLTQANDNQERQCQSLHSSALQMPLSV